MPNRKLYSGPTQLVVAFDIGTTYSTIAYCILEQGDVPEILEVTRYPGQELACGDAKVPSVLYYDRDGNFRAAGSEALAESVIEVALAEGWTKAEWWKLHLQPNHLASPFNPNDDLPPLPPEKSAVDILTDFIKYLFKCAKTYIQNKHVAFAWSTHENSIEYIFTHPNSWEGMQEHPYCQAIERAGLVHSPPAGQSRVRMLTEGEANLHLCVTNYVMTTTANEADPQGVVIIDAGSETIDLSMFSMKSNPISCEVIAPTECRLQGSVFVTRKARALLEKKLAGWEHSSEEKLSKFVREFDTSTKLLIKSDQEPAYIRVADRRYNNPKYSIALGRLKLSGAEATGLFDDSVNAVISAFEQQAKCAMVPITKAFFIGSLSTNDWLWFRIQSYFKARNIIVCRPDQHIYKAVANGAVVSYINHDNHLVPSRATPAATYCLVCALPVDENNEQHIFRKDQWVTDPTGDRYVPGYLALTFYKDSCIAEVELQKSFSLTERNPKHFGVQTIRLVSHPGKLSNPKWVDQAELSFSTFCTIHVDSSVAVKDVILRKHRGQFYYELDYNVIIFFGLTELKAYLEWKTRDGSQRRVPMIVSYDD